MERYPSAGRPERWLAGCPQSFLAAEQSTMASAATACIVAVTWDMGIQV